MLKPIHRVNCSPALASCQQLMRRFALWLCAPNIGGADVTEVKLQAHMGSVIEGNWLWRLIAGVRGNKGLLKKAQHIADLPLPEKQGLAQWITDVGTLAQLFETTPPGPLPMAPPNGWGGRHARWVAFKELMVAFYEEGLREGLPYQANGAPTADRAQQVTREQFVREFCVAHRLDPHPDAREVCVLCGGPLVLPAVDHWMGKGEFPLLAVCADNLLPICSECNGAPNKGQKPVCCNGGFTDWFHPHLRHPNGTLEAHYDEATLAVSVTSVDPQHARKVSNLDDLLNLGKRWTREFKAEYRRLQRDLDNRERAVRKLSALNEEQIADQLITYRQNLAASEPHYEVHSLVADAMLDPARMQALLDIC